MKSCKHLFEEMLKPATIAKCALEAAHGKFKRLEVLNSFVDFNETFDAIVKELKSVHLSVTS